MNRYGEKAKELFLQGYNCSQSVFGAFAEELGMDFDTAMMIAGPFGGGMGRMREVCGAVSGMLMAAGLKNGYCHPDRDAKAALYKNIQQLAEEFKKRNGRETIICRELLGLKPDGYIPEERTDAYYKKRPCADIVALAADILGEYIINDK